MKHLICKLLCLIVLLLSFKTSFAKENFYSNLKIENNNVVFEAIYNIEGLEENKIREKILDIFSSYFNITDINVVKNNITAKLVGVTIDGDRKMFPNSLSRPLYLDHPLRVLS